MTISQDWWDTWWVEDFSWDGLAKKPWIGWVALDYGRVDEIGDAPGELDQKPWGEIAFPKNYPGRQATLQDYWRDQKDDLITGPDGKIRFTRLHLPLNWRDGTPTGKTEWAEHALDDVLRDKLASSGGTDFEGLRQVKGADRRAQFQGIVFSDFDLKSLTDRFYDLPTIRDQPAGLPVSARFDNAAFVGEARFDSATFSETAGFPNAAFSGDAWFHNAAFVGNARFDDAAFSGDARFDNATFSGSARFSSAAFSGSARFGNAQIQKGAFVDARFARDVLFSAGKLGPDVDFEGARFSEPHHLSRWAFGVFAVLCLISAGAMIVAANVSGWTSWGFAGLASVSALCTLVWCVVGGEFVGIRINADLQSSQIGMRVLRKAAREWLNHELEAVAHAAELKYSRLRMGRGWRVLTKPIERFFSCLYEAFSDYGQSIFRPFLWLGIFILGMAGGYYSWADRHMGTDVAANCYLTYPAPISAVAPKRADIEQAPTRCAIDPNTAIWQALEFSWSNTFKPLSALSTSNDNMKQNALAHSLLYTSERDGNIDATGFWVRVTATMQSLLSIVLAFLLGLAVRRRFQIS